jgi:hypothetical protein
MPQPKTDKAGQTVTPVMLTYVGDGETPITNADLVAIITSLIDDTIKGLLRSVGDAGASPANTAGQTILYRLTSIATSLLEGKQLLGFDRKASTFTTTPLSAGATFTGASQDWGSGYPHSVGFYNVMAYSDQDGTIYLEQSHDNSNWDYSESQALTGGMADKLKSPIYARYVRPRYVNGGTGQTVFRFGGRGAIA